MYFVMIAGPGYLTRSTRFAEQGKGRSAVGLPFEHFSRLALPSTTPESRSWSGRESRLERRPR